MRSRGSRIRGRPAGGRGIIPWESLQPEEGTSPAVGFSPMRVHRTNPFPSHPAWAAWNTLHLPDLQPSWTREVLIRAAMRATTPWLVRGGWELAAAMAPVREEKAYIPKNHTTDARRGLYEFLNWQPPHTGSSEPPTTVGDSNDTVSEGEPATEPEASPPAGRPAARAAPPLALPPIPPPALPPPSPRPALLALPPIPPETASPPSPDLTPTPREEGLRNLQRSWVVQGGDWLPRDQLERLYDERRNGMWMCLDPLGED